MNAAVTEDANVKPRTPLHTAIEFVGIYAERAGVTGSDPRFRSVDWKAIPKSRSLLQRLSTLSGIIVHSKLLSEDLNLNIDAQARAIESWLSSVGLPWDSVWVHSGKPVAHYYIETFNQLEYIVEKLEGFAHE